MWHVVNQLCIICLTRKTTHLLTALNIGDLKRQNDGLMSKGKVHAFFLVSLTMAIIGSVVCGLVYVLH